MEQADVAQGQVLDRLVAISAEDLVKLLGEAAELARTAEARARAGNGKGAVRTLSEVEMRLYGANRLIDLAMSAARRPVPVPRLMRHK